MKNDELKNEIIIYTGDNGKSSIEVRMQGETVWLSQAQLVELYRSSKANVSEHIKNIFTEGELSPESTVRKIRTVQKEGNRDVSRVAAHGHTASEVIYLRVDSNKPFAGLTNFKGAQPTQAEAMVAKNYLDLKELKVLNNAGSVSHEQAEKKAMVEYRKFKAKTLSEVEKSYLESLKQIEKQMKKKQK